MRGSPCSCHSWPSCIRRAWTLPRLPLGMSGRFEISPACKMLWLDRTQVSDLEPIQGLANLQELRLANTQVSDLDPLRGSPTCKRSRSTAPRSADLDPIRGRANLQKLSGSRHRTQVRRRSSRSGGSPTCKCSRSPTPRSASSNRSGGSPTCKRSRSTTRRSATSTRSGGSPTANALARRHPGQRPRPDPGARRTCKGLARPHSGQRPRTDPGLANLQELWLTTRRSATSTRSGSSPACKCSRSKDPGLPRRSRAAGAEGARRRGPRPLTLAPRWRSR